jgi:hypothetical protein
MGMHCTIAARPLLGIVHSFHAAICRCLPLTVKVDPGLELVAPSFVNTSKPGLEWHRRGIAQEKKKKIGVKADMSGTKLEAVLFYRVPPLA